MPDAGPGEMASPADSENSGTPLAAAAGGRTENQDPEAGGDRNFRGGDRRGRRSRRRRTRSGGFPENKYAQANGPVAGTTPAERVTPVERDVTEAPADVIVLPGESLAKYRRVSPMAPVEPDPIESKLPDPPEPDTEYADAGAESEGDGEHATEEELAQEAQEIALTDLVFSTREDASAQAVEERVAGVEEQRPAETTPTEFEHAAASTQTEEQPRETGEMARFVLPDEHEPSDSPLAANEPQALDEYELRAIREGLVDEQETSLEEVDGEAPPFEEALESEPTEETPSAITEAGVAGAEQPQTATLREQGDRSMHRVSRRMRRRRGGNRLGPQGREGTVNVRGPEPVAGIGAGTAAAPEVRPETRVEPTRERSEERSGKDRTESIPQSPTC